MTVVLEYSVNDIEEKKEKKKKKKKKASDFIFNKIRGVSRKISRKIIRTQRK